MKVGIVQPVIGSIGGNDMVLHSMIKALKGHDITLYTFSKTEIDGVRVLYKAPIRIPFFGIYQKLLVPKFDMDDDVIICMGCQVNSKKRTIIYDQNNMGSNETPDKYKKGFWKYYYLPYNSLVKNNFAKSELYSVSEYSANLLREKSGKDVKVIYPGVPLNEFYRKEKDIPICMVGRISPDKNLEYAITILNQIPAKCVIFGNVTTTNIPYFNKLKKMAKSHIQFQSGNRDELKDVLARSKVYFSASKETFGISTVEAMASGCIPVVPDHSAHPEVVPYPELRYGDCYNILCDAIDGLFDDYTFEHIKKFDTVNFEREINELVG